MYELLGEFSEHLLERGLSRETAKSYRKRVREFMDWLEGRTLTVKTVREYMDYCRERAVRAQDGKPYKATGNNQRLAALKAYSAWLVSTNRAKTDVAAGLRAQKMEVRDTAPDVMSEDDLSRFLAAVHGGRNIRDIAIVKLMLKTGLRVNELTQLTPADLELTGDHPMVRVRLGKGGKPRAIPVSAPDLQACLGEYLSQRDPKSSRLFDISARGIAAMLKRYAKAAGIEMNMHPHLLRHQFATELVRKEGADIVMVADLMGHADINTTAIYTKPTMEQKGSMLARLFSGADRV